MERMAAGSSDGSKLTPSIPVVGRVIRAGLDFVVDFTARLEQVAEHRPVAQIETLLDGVAAFRDHYAGQRSPSLFTRDRHHQATERVVYQSER